MGEHSKIEWTDHTFNPWVGCTKISPACDHCYAEGWAKRSGRVTWGEDRRRTSTSTWYQPHKWNAAAERAGVRARVFCASLADVFDNEVPWEWRKDLLMLIAQTPNLDWLLLTKRIGNAAKMLDQAVDHLAGEGKVWTSHPWPHVWIGATIANQEEADRDIPKLLATPASVRFLSMEPLLGPVDLYLRGQTPACDRCSVGVMDATNPHVTGACRCKCHGPRLDWVIAGGESGPGARPMSKWWVQNLRDQCVQADVAFHFKQWGEWAPADDDTMLKLGKKAAGRLLDGRTWDELPARG